MLRLEKVQFVNSAIVKSDFVKFIDENVWFVIVILSRAEIMRPIRFFFYFGKLVEMSDPHLVHLNIGTEYVALEKRIALKEKFGLHRMLEQ